nr:pantoate--beta-alanine ligase [Candidatus Aminicenantes bacterium]
AEARTLIEAGERDAGRVLSRMRALIEAEPAARIDYVAAVRPENLEPVSALENGTLIALAVWIGRTRLIDNLIVA